MHILVCAATGREIQKTIQQIAEGKYGRNVDILITGVGLTATTYYLTKQVITKRPEMIIQAGVCGSINDELMKGEVVAVLNESIGDEMVFEDGRWKSLFELGLCDQNKMPWSECRLHNKYIDEFPAAHLRKVNSVSVNEISTQVEKIMHYKEYHNADVESLEGAALHYVGLSEDIPFLQIRSVSNVIGERDKTKWDLDIAITNLNKELEQIVAKLSNR